MSGGSWDYLCDKMDEAADRLRESGNPHRRAFGALMARCATAMHEIEWYDSCDTSGEAVQPAIEAALGANAGALVLDEARQRVEAMIEAARELLTRFPPKSDRPDAGEGRET